MFSEGNIIYRSGVEYQIDAALGTRIYLINTSDKHLIKEEVDKLNDEFLKGDLIVEGFDGPGTKQLYLTEKQLARINMRKKFAKAFNLNNISRRDTAKIIESIGLDLNLPPKSLPSRATCYRWAKLLRDADGDITVLR